MDFKKYFNGTFLESSTDYMVKSAIDAGRKFSKKLPADQKVLEELILKEFKTVFGGLNKNIVIPINVDAEKYKSYDYKNLFYYECLHFTANGAHPDPNGFLAYNKALGNTYINLLMVLNKTVNSPFNMKISDAGFNTDLKSTGITEVIDFNCVVNLFGNVAEGANLESIKTFVDFLNTLNLNEIKILASYDIKDNSDKIIVAEVSLKYIFKTISIITEMVFL
jgi:hypothetical protein